MGHSCLLSKDLYHHKMLLFSLEIHHEPIYTKEKTEKPPALKLVLKVGGTQSETIKDIYTHSPHEERKHKHHKKKKKKKDKEKERHRHSEVRGKLVFLIFVLVIIVSYMNCVTVSDFCGEKIYKKLLTKTFPVVLYSFETK